MKNFNQVLDVLKGEKAVQVIKVGAMVASVVGMVGTAFATTMDNKNTLKKLVDDHFNKQ